MGPDLFNKVEEVFYDYASKYDENIKSLFEQRNIDISQEELQEILDKAKNMVDQ